MDRVECLLIADFAYLQVEGKVEYVCVCEGGSILLELPSGRCW